MIRFNSRTSEYAWLSNFHRCLVTDKKSRTWLSVEHFYQAMKFERTSGMVFDMISNSTTAAEAKRVAKTFSHLVRDDWDKVKLGIMMEALRYKFREFSDLANRLLDTGEEELQEFAPWGDRFWGVDRNGVGENWMGRLLMKVRDELRHVESL